VCVVEFVGAVFDMETANAAETRQALQREVWRHNNRSVVAASSPQLFVYDAISDMSRQFQLSKSRTSSLSDYFSYLRQSLFVCQLDFSKSCEQMLTKICTRILCGF